MCALCPGTGPGSSASVKEYWHHDLFLALSFAPLPLVWQELLSSSSSSKQPQKCPSGQNNQRVAQGSFESRIQTESEKLADLLLATFHLVVLVVSVVVFVLLLLAGTGEVLLLQSNDLLLQ